MREWKEELRRTGGETEAWEEQGIDLKTTDALSLL